MRWVGRQAELVDLLPCSNAHRGGIEVGSLLGQLLPSLFGTLRFVRREGLSVIFAQIARAGQRHMEPNPVNERKGFELGTGYTSCRGADEISSVRGARLAVVGTTRNTLRKARARHGYPPLARPDSAGSVAARAAPASSTGSGSILGLVYPKRAAFKVLAIERLDCPACIRI